MAYDFSVIRHLRQRMELTITALSRKSRISYVALSKLERNAGNPELKTLDRVARGLGIETHNLLALAEHKRAQIVGAEKKTDPAGFKSLGASMDRVRVAMVQAAKGSKGAEDHQDRDSYEICLVVSGKLKLIVLDNVYQVKAGQAAQFDCIFKHHYEVAEDASFVRVQVPKRT